MTVDSGSAPAQGTQSLLEVLRGLLRGPFMVVWFLLIAATLLLWYLGAEHAVPNAHLATVLILIVAFIKWRFVGLYFMELRDAPVPLRMLFEAQCATVCAVVLGVYLFL
jgi:hypothetical protein